MTAAIFTTTTKGTTDMSKHKQHIAGNGYTEWPTDREVLTLATNMTKGAKNICHNQATIVIRAMESIVNRLPENSQSRQDLLRIGQEFYNLAGAIASAIDYSNGNYEIANPYEQFIVQQ